MNSPTTSHPDVGQLLSYADGELSSSDTASVEAHVCACGECEQWLARVRAVDGQYLSYHRAVLKTRSPAPPEPWFDLCHRLREMDAEHVHERRRPSVAGNLRWLAAAAAVVVAIFVYRFSSEQTVSAAELLDKASLRETLAVIPRRNIRVKTRKAVYVRPALLRTRVPKLSSVALNSELRARFETARYDWDDPLSARAFVAWRNTVPEKKDSVTILRNTDGRFYNVRTVAANNELTEATLTLRASDLHAVQETFEFRDAERIEISETDLDLLVTEPPARVASGSPVQKAPAIAETPAGPAEELQVLAALNRIGADLGEPIEVERRSDDIVVTGLGLSGARRQQIESAVSGIPGVEVRFEEPAPVRKEGTATAPDVVSADENPLRSQLENQLGGRAMLEQFVNQVLDNTEAALARVHALRNLAQRFPPEVERALFRHDREVLESLRRQHSNWLLRQANHLSDTLRPVFGSVDAQASTCTDWHDCTADLVRISQQMDQILSRALAAEGADSHGDEAFANVRSAFARWHARVTAYQASFDRRRPGLKE